MDTVSTIIDVAVCPFKNCIRQRAQENGSFDLANNYHVEDLDGHLVEAEIEDLSKLGYTLPKDKFITYIARQVRVTVPVHLAPLLNHLPALEGKSTLYHDGLFQNVVIDTPFVT